MTDDANWRDRALKAEAELARVTAEAAVLREAMADVVGYTHSTTWSPDETIQGALLWATTSASSTTVKETQCS